MPCPDPHWLVYFSALGTPIVALIAAGWGALIAYRQWHTARDRFRLDLFDKRFKTYAAARDTMSCASLRDEEIAARFVSETREAKWVLSSEIANYLENSVAPKLFRLIVLNKRQDNLSLGHPEMVDLVTQRRNSTDGESHKLTFLRQNVLPIFS